MCTEEDGPPEGFPVDRGETEEKVGKSLRWKSLSVARSESGKHGVFFLWYPTY